MGDATQDAVMEVVANLVGRPVAADEPLISSGVIDSLAVLRLITALEKKLAITIPTTAVQPEDFDSVEIILETIQRVTA